MFEPDKGNGIAFRFFSRRGRIDSRMCVRARIESFATSREERRKSERRASAPLLKKDESLSFESFLRGVEQLVQPMQARRLAISSLSFSILQIRSPQLSRVLDQRVSATKTGVKGRRSGPNHAWHGLPRLTTDILSFLSCDARTHDISTTERRERLERVSPSPRDSQCRNRSGNVTLPFFLSCH